VVSVRKGESTRVRLQVLRAAPSEGGDPPAVPRAGATRTAAEEPTAPADQSSTRIAVTRRRRVDWPIILGPGAPAPKVVERSGHGKLSSLLAGFSEIQMLDDPDQILRRAIELARDQIGLSRAGIFLLDRLRNLMLGTWGTDLQGAVVDEHQVMYGVGDTDREAFGRSTTEGAHYTVFDDYPIVEHRGEETLIAGRGWVACTPIRSRLFPIGMMFNDAGLTGAPVDERKQAHVAILCSLLGTMLDPVRGTPGRGAAPSGESLSQRLVPSVRRMLAEDPALGGKEIAARLDISPSRLARVFKSEMGMSFVEYRNRLRLDRFFALLVPHQANLLETALAAGFGSYAQFNRVFRAHRHLTPREYLRRKA
jgi:AraC-like DNA-binding protein